MQSQTSGVSGFVPASFIEITEDYRNFTEEGVASAEFYEYDATSETPGTIFHRITYLNNIWKAPVAENTTPEALPQTEATA